MAKVTTIKQIEQDERIESFVRNYDGAGVHMVECKDGYRFENENSTMEIGNVSEICYSINNYLIKTNP